MVEGLCSACHRVSPVVLLLPEPPNKETQKIQGTVQEIFLPSFYYNKNCWFCGIKMTMEDRGQRHWAPLPATRYCIAKHSQP